MKIVDIRFTRLLLIGILLPTIFFNTSCVSTKNVVYFNNISDTTLQSNTPLPETRIQKNDLLSIAISDVSEKAVDRYASPNKVSAIASQVPSFLVNEDGKIQLPEIGLLQAAGLTKEELRKSIVKSILDAKFLVDPIVSIRFLNFRVTVLGEVAHPTVVAVIGEKISLLEAIGYAGDLTLEAKRDNVMVIREEEGVKTIKRVNLNTTEIFSSPYYYLKSNDIVYVEPGKAKIASTKHTPQWIPAVLSGLGLAITIAVFFKN